MRDGPLRCLLGRPHRISTTSGDSNVHGPRACHKRMENGWTAQRRREQARAIRRWKPWERSTGPRTGEGRARSSRNAYKGRQRPAWQAFWREVRDALSQQAGAVTGTRSANSTTAAATFAAGSPRRALLLSQRTRQPLRMWWRWRRSVESTGQNSKNNPRPAGGLTVTTPYQPFAGEFRGA